MIHKLITPKSREVTLSFTVPEDYIGEEMEVIAFIKKENRQASEQIQFLSPAMQGNPLTNEEFVNWISDAEKLPTISLQDAEDKWIKKRKQLQRLIK